MDQHTEPMYVSILPNSGLYIGSQKARNKNTTSVPVKVSFTFFIRVSVRCFVEHNDSLR